MARLGNEDEFGKQRLYRRPTIISESSLPTNEGRALANKSASPSFPVPLKSSIIAEMSALTLELSSGKQTETEKYVDSKT